MRVVRAREVDALAGLTPTESNGLHVTWLEGPASAAQLDVGVATLTETGAAPPHTHHGGQVIVVLAGRGFVETADERVQVGPGDVVITPPGEMHSHGSDENQSFAHLTITTGGVDIPGRANANSTAGA